MQAPWNLKKSRTKNMDGRQRNDVMITDIDRNPRGPENNIHRDYLIIIVKIHQIKTL